MGRLSANILLLSDDPVTGALVERMLARLDYAAPIRTLDREAELRDPCDVVVVDVDALDAGQHAALRRMIRNPASRRPGIIAMSACFEAAAEVPSDAVDVRLAKPLTLPMFAAALDRLCRADGFDPRADFDASHWRRLLELFGRDGLKALVDTVVADLPVRQARFSDALRERDRTQLRGLAHALRGACQQLGAERLATIACAIEMECDAPGAFADGARLMARYVALVGSLDEAIAGL